jgi:hypothetical protein
MITDLTPGFVNDVFSWINKSREGKGMGYVSDIASRNKLLTAMSF